MLGIFYDFNRVERYNIKSKAIVKDGIIRIETPHLRDGQKVEVSIGIFDEEETDFFAIAPSLAVGGLPTDYSVTHKEKARESA